MAVVGFTTGNSGRLVSPHYSIRFPRPRSRCCLTERRHRLRCRLPTNQRRAAIYRILYETVRSFCRPRFSLRRLGDAGCHHAGIPAGSVLSARHEIITKEVPSRLSTEIAIGIALGSTDYLAVLPDYLGLGTRRVFIPIIMPAPEATAVVADLLQGGEAFLRFEFHRLEPATVSLRIFPGGHATMAAHREIEAFHTNEFTITASAPWPALTFVRGHHAGFSVEPPDAESILFCISPGELPECVSSRGAPFDNAYRPVFVRFTALAGYKGAKQQGSSIGPCQHTRRNSPTGPASSIYQ